MWRQKRDRQTDSRSTETEGHLRGKRKTRKATPRRWSGGREADSLTDSKRRTGRQADRQLRRSTGSHTVRPRYPGNGQLISHLQTTEFSSVNLYCPQGIIRKGKQADTWAERWRGQTGHQGETDGHVGVQWLNALLNTRHTLILL